MTFGVCLFCKLKKIRNHKLEKRRLIYINKILFCLSFFIELFNNGMTAVLLLLDELWTNYDNIERLINKDDRQRLSSSLQQVDFTYIV